MPHEIEQSTGRFICTPENPMPKDAEGRWAHSKVKALGGGDETEDYICMNCGHEWTEELPQ